MVGHCGPDGLDHVLAGEEYLDTLLAGGTRPRTV